MVRIGKFEAQVVAAVVRLGNRATAGQIFHDILDSGERALLANVYVTLDRLEEKKAVLRNVQRQRTPDGAVRDVNVYTLTDLGRQALTEAIEKQSRSLATLRTVTS